jgi:hypothetical protein
MLPKTFTPFNERMNQAFVEQIIVDLIINRHFQTLKKKERFEARLHNFRPKNKLVKILLQFNP